MKWRPPTLLVTRERSCLSLLLSPLPHPCTSRSITVGSLACTSKLAVLPRICTTTAATATTAAAAAAAAAAAIAAIAAASDAAAATVGAASKPAATVRSWTVNPDAAQTQTLGAAGWTSAQAAAEQTISAPRVGAWRYTNDTAVWTGTTAAMMTCVAATVVAKSAGRGTGWQSVTHAEGRGRTGGARGVGRVGCERPQERRGRSRGGKTERAGTPTTRVGEGRGGTTILAEQLPLLRPNGRRPAARTAASSVSSWM